MIGDCPTCGSSNTGDCENDPDIKRFVLLCACSKLAEVGQPYSSQLLPLETEVKFSKQISFAIQLRVSMHAPA